jgi:pimeloyl-ACP methyl ester carboxylesterase
MFARRSSLAAAIVGNALQCLKPLPLVAAEGYAELPGVRLWYTDTGGDGQALILLHANTGTSANWAPQNADFAAAGYRVIAFDRRGWGQSVC